jgi:ubiquinone/menaquinone biosynthesis C-methylase UbiE
MSGAAWWRTYFDERYFEMHDPLFTDALSRAEVAGMCELLGLPLGARVLDAPCGWGRHSALLAGAGMHVVGADISLDLLRHAPRGEDPDAAAAGAERAAYVAADIRHLPFPAASFTAVLNVFTSLGLFLSDEDDRAALCEARRVLEPGGALLFESMHRDDVLRSFAPSDEWTLPDGTQVQVRRRFDAVSGISHERLRWRRGEMSGRKTHALRLRTATEIDALLRAAGFSRIDYFGSFAGRPFSYRSASLIALAR